MHCSHQVANQLQIAEEHPESLEAAENLLEEIAAVGDIVTAAKTVVDLGDTEDPGVCILVVEDTAVGKLP
jgi:hypothetical protein